MNNNNIEQNNGQMAHTINNRGPVNYWSPSPPPPPEDQKLMRMVPRKHRPKVDQVLEVGNLTATDLIAPFKTMALGFAKDDIVRQYVALDYFCGLMFGGYFFLWSAVSLI